MLLAGQVTEEHSMAMDRTAKNDRATQPFLKGNQKVV